jgi:hypothetical protein
VVILNVDNDNDVFGSRFFDLQNQSELVVQAHRVLVAPVAFQFFEIVPADCAQVAFIDGGSNRLHSSPECLNEIRSETRGESEVGLKPIKVAVQEFDLH